MPDFGLLAFDDHHADDAPMRGVCSNGCFMRFTASLFEGKGEAGVRRQCGAIGLAR